jgi:xylitol oxidase
VSGGPRNWAGNISYGAASYPRPDSVAGLRQLVAAAQQVRVVGSGHSFSPLAVTPGTQVSLAGLPPVLDIDTARGTVTVSAGLRYQDLAAPLHRAGLALPNLASLPGITVAGACATGTHGSGDRLGSLATQVAGLELITATGELVTVGRDGAGGPLTAMVVALGALGVVTRVTLDTVPAFELRQYVYDGLPLSEVTSHLAEITAAAYSVSLFTRWREPRFDQAWLKLGPGDQPPGHHWMGGTRAASPRHPVAGQPPGNCTTQLGVPGPWFERLPHFRAGATPSAGAELQSEYLIPAAHGAAALTALSGLAARLAPVVQVTEIRTVAPDELWLSPAYRRPSIGVHFTWTDDLAAVRPVLALVEHELAPFGPRPHWAKLFGISPAEVAAAYPRLPDFRNLMLSRDPAGKFRNPMLAAYLLDEPR